MNKKEQFQELGYGVAIAITILFAIFILGIFVPFIITALIAGFTPLTIGDIISSSAVFWVFSVIGWFVSAVYVNDVVSN